VNGAQVRPSARPAFTTHWQDGFIALTAALATAISHLKERNDVQFHD